MIRSTLLLLLVTHWSISQSLTNSGIEVLGQLNQKREMAKTSLVKNIRFENIGPTVMSGRVVDLDVNPDNPIEFYVAYASGGLWYTDNNGTSFKPVMDNSDTQNIGDIAVHWPSGTIWVGTGENNASRSSYAGIGILKSTDKGTNWQLMGLPDSHHIGRILINPDNPEEVVVGITGHLYTGNQERGVYKTLDGGLNWKKTLFIDDKTGIIDLAFVPGNFNIQYAASWDKDRKAWNFRGSGENSGIHKSIDGGETWSKLSVEGSGLPTGEGVGRFGLAVFDQNTVYALHDSQYRREEKESPKTDPEILTKNDFKNISVKSFMKIENEKLNTYLRENKFPEKYTASVVKKLVTQEKIVPADLAGYLDNANSVLFELPVIGAEVYRSDDAGRTWNKMNDSYIDDLYYSYGYYFGQIRVDPEDKDKIYLGGVPLLKSEDGGKTYMNISGDNVHADHHALWINPNKTDHLINGNDGGVNISYDGGAHWIKNNTPSVGQFYAINVDYQESYMVYGGLQDNGVWMGPHNGKESDAWHQSGHYDWKSIMWGDGMQIQIDRTNPNVVYTGFQFGNYYRLDLVGDFKENIQPKHELGEPAFRFNWQTPILLSPHNQDILYMGSNKLHRSMNQGKAWKTISDDLTNGSKEGNVAFATITTISESPFKFGLLYVGTDDGLVQKSQDGGTNWNKISDALPEKLWISEVLASRHEENRVYVCLNGYRNDDFTTYIYTSDDGGASWNDISANIPESPVNALAEDKYNENLLFAGTDNGLYLSFDRGKSWELFQTGIPNVAIHDLVIQDDARDLLVGTHGRSIYKTDISVLQQVNNSILNSGLYIFDLPEVYFSDKWGNPENTWQKPDTPGLDIVFYAGASGEFACKVSTLDDVVVSETTIKADKGLNVLSYDLAFSKMGKSAYLSKYKKELLEAKDGKTYLPKGIYRAEVSNSGLVEIKEFKIIDKTNGE